MLEKLSLDFDTVADEKATRVCKEASSSCKGETQQQAMALSLALHPLLEQVLPVSLECSSGCASKVGSTLCEGKVAASVGAESRGCNYSKCGACDVTYTLFAVHFLVSLHGSNFFSEAMAGSVT